MLPSSIKTNSSSPRVKPAVTAGIEWLESRIAPAGVVNVELLDGVLTITGDADDNSIEVQGAIGDQFVVLANGGTVLNGGPSKLAFDLPATGLATIVADLGEGNDSIQLRELLVRGDVTLNDAGGGLSANTRELSARNFTTTGSDATDSLSADGLLLRGNFTADLGGGTNFLSISGMGSKILGTLSYTGGSGHDGMNLTDIAVKRGVELALASSQATVSFYGNLSIQGGIHAASSNSLNFSMSPNVATIRGDVAIELLGPGPNEVHFTAFESLDLRGRLQVTGSGGDDELSFTGQRLNVAGGVNFDGGEGENTFSQAAAFFSTSTLTVKGGGGNDSIDFFGVNTTIKGLASFTLGDGDNHLHANGSGVIFLGAFGYTGGAAFDALRAHQSWQVRGTSQIEFGAGSTIMEFYAMNASFGGRVDIHTASEGMVGSEVRLQPGNLTIGKGLFITQTGDAGQSVDIDPGNWLRLKGGLTYQGGAGADDIDIGAKASQSSGAIVVNTGDGNNDVFFSFERARVSSPITVTTGSGNDSIRFQALATTYNAPVKIFAGGGDNEIRLDQNFGSAVFLKPVQIVSESTGTDSLEVEMASFLGGLNVRLGAGISTVDIDDVIVRGKSVIDTGAGNDTLRLERAETRAASIIAGLLDLQLGEGDDTVLIGEGTDFNRIHVMARLIVNGGAGTDTINDVVGLAQVGAGGSVTLLEFP